MEQHPVPQNVTTFQFRLIGDMTIKQFGYLCAGAILAFIAYKLPLPFIITWPLTGAFAFLGIGFAFIPIEERPMDVWVFSFFKSIYSPTQYIWNHNHPTQPNTSPNPSAPSGNTLPQSASQTSTPIGTTSAILPPTPVPIAPSAPKSVLSGLFQTTPTSPQQGPGQNHVRIVEQHTSLMDEIISFFFPKHPKPQSAPLSAPLTPKVTGHLPVAAAAPPPQAVPTTQEVAMHQKMKQLEETLATLETRLATKSVTEDRVLELQKQLTDVLAAKNKTEEELVSIKRKMVPPSPPPIGHENTAPLSRGTVNVITTQEGAVKVGLPRLTNVPNVITGLVKDDASNLLPGILVTVTNHEGMPVRALKTNKLGQFAASTQLTSGTYFVEIEDPRKRFTFTRVQITLNGSVVPVLEIIARSEKALTRERLAQEIFGNTSL